MNGTWLVLRDGSLLCLETGASIRVSRIGPPLDGHYNYKVYHKMPKEGKGGPMLVSPLEDVCQGYIHQIQNVLRERKQLIEV